MHLWIVGACGKIENGERKRRNDLIKKDHLWPKTRRRLKSHCFVSVASSSDDAVSASKPLRNTAKDIIKDYSPGISTALQNERQHGREAVIWTQGHELYSWPCSFQHETRWNPPLPPGFSVLSCRFSDLFKMDSLFTFIPLINNLINYVIRFSHQCCSSLRLLPLHLSINKWEAMNPLHCTLCSFSTLKIIFQNHFFWFTPLTEENGTQQPQPARIELCNFGCLPGTV